MNPKYPKYIVTASEEMPWTPCDKVPGVYLKNLGNVNGWTMELFKFEPNTPYPDHIHQAPEFVYMLEGEVIRDGEYLGPGYGSAGETGTLDKDFRSGADGCIFLSIYCPSHYSDA